MPFTLSLYQITYMRGVRMDKTDLTKDEETIIDALRADPEFSHDLAEILGRQEPPQQPHSSDPGEHPGAS